MKDLGVTDLIAAFDVILHTMLLKRMEDLGVRGRAMQDYFVKSCSPNDVVSFDLIYALL